MHRGTVSLTPAPTGETKRSAADFMERACRAMHSMGYPVPRALTDDGRCFTSNLGGTTNSEHTHHLVAPPIRRLPNELSNDD